MQPIIRDALPADAPALSALIRRAVRVLNSRDYESRIIDLICVNFSPSNVLARMNERDVFVSAAGNRMVGTIGLGGHRVHSLFVDPDRQGEGIGTHLLFHLERHALAKGTNELELSSSVTARPFYLKHGYAQIAFEERADGSTYLMRKSLTPR